MAKDPQIKRLMIDETRKILEEHGNVTIKEIAERCYVNIASVNYYFGSKENLIFIVISEVLSEIKQMVFTMVDDKQDKTPEAFLEEIIGLIYNFSLDHVGILSYLFMANGMKDGQLAEFVRSFFLDPEFVQMVYKNLGEQLNTNDIKLLQVKYMIIFSSFFMPLFIQIIHPSDDEEEKMEMFRDPVFKKHFTEQILKIIA
ncbi:MAG: TetR/AcrR family transcriptional regulator [Acholeplasmataceae bacterium]